LLEGNGTARPTPPNASNTKAFSCAANRTP
jgi:hypothetical protein